MSDVLLGIFKDSKHAGMAVSEFVQQGITDDITVISKEGSTGDVSTQQVQQDLTEGTTAGTIAGATVGTLAALLAGAASFTLPGLGLIVLGPLAAALTGLGAGALTGGLVGAMIDWGIPDATARDYEQRIQAGEVLVGVSTNRIDTIQARAILEKHGANEIHTIQTRR